MNRKKTFWQITSGLIFLGFSARAETLSSAPASSAIFWMFAGFSVVSTLLVIWSIVKLVEFIRRARRAEAKTEWTMALLNASPDAFITWDAHGRFICSERLSKMLGFTDVPPDYASLCSKNGGLGFDKSDFAELTKAISRLRERGHDDRIHLKLKAGTITIGAEGAILTGYSVGEIVCVVWFFDETARQSDLAEKNRQLAAEEYYRKVITAVLDEVGIPVWRRGPDLKLEWVNEAYAKAVEAPSCEAAVTDQIELVSNALTGGPARLAAVRLKGGGAYSEKHYVVIDGQRRAIEVTHIGDAENKKSLIGYAMDVTEVDDVRSELSRYTESHAETLNKLSTAVAIFGSDKTLEYFNSAFVKLWKLPEDWLQASPHHSELLERMREMRRLPEQADFLAWKQEQLSFYTDLTEPSEDMWYLPDASILRVVFQPHPLGGLLIFFEDLTDHLALERSYNTLFAVQNATLNNLHEAVAVFGSDGRLKLYNASFCKVWALGDDFLSLKPHMSEIIERCGSFFTDLHDGEVFGAQMINDNNRRVVGDGRLQRADGSVVDYTAVPLPDGATLMTYLDVTDSIRIERALRERNDALEAADRLKTEFIAHVSYGLRTPLNSVIGFAELLDREYYGPLNSQQRGYTRNILESSSQLMVLINGIIDLSVIAAGRMQLELSEVNLAEILTSVAERIREEARSRNLRVDLDLPQQLETIMADEQRVKQVLYNLTGNALKFTLPGGKITLGAKSEGGNVQLYVADTGIGIAPEDQESIFETFETGGQVTENQGAGLGLSLVRRFVELHQGRVELQSEPGKGTRVICIFPGKDASAQKFTDVTRSPAAQLH
jgi:signal transduction histidine kinase